MKIDMPDLNNERILPGGITVKAVFHPDCKWRLLEPEGLREEMKTVIENMRKNYS